MMNARILPRSVLVIDDDTLPRKITSTYLSQNGFHVFQTHKLSLARDCLCGTAPDLILINWTLAESNTQAFVDELRELLAHPHTPVVGIADDAGERQVIEALEAGADDFMIRPFSPALVLARVMAVLRRRAPEHSGIDFTVGPLTLSPGRHEVVCAVGKLNIRLEIGPTEFRLLHFLMSKPELAHTRMEIRNKVWSDDQVIDERTVDAHIKRLRNSLAQTGVDRMVQTVRMVGYRLSCKPTSKDEISAALPDKSRVPARPRILREPLAYGPQQSAA